MHMHQGQRVLTHHGDIVPSKPVKEVIAAFIEWLPIGAVLVAHNGRAFDNLRLIRVMDALKMTTQFMDKVHAMGDTLPYMKEVFPDSPSYTLSSLCTEHLGLDYDAHDALEDCHALKKLVEHAIAKLQGALQRHCWTLESVIKDVQYKNGQQERYNTVVDLVSDKIISQAMGKKIAGSGLMYSHLETIAKRDGFDGLSAVFKCKTGNAVRVTNSTKIITAVFKHFSED